MAARVEAMEQALAAREAQLAQDATVPCRSGSAGGLHRPWDRHAGAAQWQPPPPWVPQTAAGISAETRIQHSSAGCGAPRSQRAADSSVDARSPCAAAERWPAEDRCCMKGSRPQRVAAAVSVPRAGRRHSSARPSREVSAAHQPAPQASASCEHSCRSSDHGISSAPPQTEAHCTSVADARSPTARPDEEPQPRAWLPAPLPSHRMPASRWQGDTKAKAPRQRRAEEQHGHDESTCSDSGGHDSRLSARSRSEGISDCGQPADRRQTAPAVTAKTAAQGAADVAGIIRVSTEHCADVGPQRNSPRLAGGPPPALAGAGGTAGNLTAVIADNAALRTALQASHESLAVAVDTNQRGDARLQELTEELARCDSDALCLAISMLTQSTSVSSNIASS